MWKFGILFVVLIINASCGPLDDLDNITVDSNDVVPKVKKDVTGGNVPVPKVDTKPVGGVIKPLINKVAIDNLINAIKASTIAINEKVAKILDKNLKVMSSVLIDVSADLISITGDISNVLKAIQF